MWTKHSSQRGSTMSKCSKMRAAITRNTASNAERKTTRRRTLLHTPFRKRSYGVSRGNASWREMTMTGRVCQIREGVAACSFYRMCGSSRLDAYTGQKWLVNSVTMLGVHRPPTCTGCLGFRVRITRKKNKSKEKREWEDQIYLKICEPTTLEEWILQVRNKIQR